MISGTLLFAAGFAVGWLVFERPEWANKLIDKIKAKVGG